MPDSGVSPGGLNPARDSFGNRRLAQPSAHVFSELPHGVRVVWIDGRETREERRRVAGAVQERPKGRRRDAEAGGNRKPGFRELRQVGALAANVSEVASVE